MSDHVENCILYVFDSLRYDAVASEQPGFATPTIDTIAADGYSFDSAWAQATWTYASAASIFSGLYPAAHNCHQYADTLTPEMPHIVDGTNKTDLTTACFSTTYGVSPERGFEQEFDEFYFFGDDGDPVKPNIMKQLTDELISWIEDHSDDRFFVVVWAMGTHHPYLTPDDVNDPTEPVESGDGVPGTATEMKQKPADAVNEVKSRYGQAVTYSDSKLGELIDMLKQENVYKYTELVVTSDHGEMFDEHARMEFANPLLRKVASTLLPEDTRRNLGLFDTTAFVGHQAIFPADELIHIPLIYKPGRDRWKGTDIDTDVLVELVDLLPTIRSGLGLETRAAVQGRDLYKLTTSNPKTHVFSSTRIHNGPLTFHSVGDGRFKYVKKQLDWSDVNKRHPIRAIESVANCALGSKSLLLDGDEEIVDEVMRDELRSLIEKHVNKCKQPSFESNRVGVDERTKENLANLGYR